MNDVDNGYQAVARLLNVITMPSTLFVLLAIVVALVAVADPTDKAMLVAVMAGLFLASQTAIEIASGLGDTHIHNTAVGNQIPWEDYEGDDVENPGYFGDGADEVDDLYG